MAFPSEEAVISVYVCADMIVSFVSAVVYVCAQERGKESDIKETDVISL